jgi:hypothetical protein
MFSEEWGSESEEEGMLDHTSPMPKWNMDEIIMLNKQGRSDLAHTLYQKTRGDAPYKCDDISRLHHEGMDGDAHDLFARTFELADTFSADEIATLQLYQFTAEAKQLYDQTWDRAVAFEIDDISKLHHAGLDDRAKSLFVHTAPKSLTFNVSGHIAKLARYGYITQAKQLYKLTVKHTKTFDTFDIQLLYKIGLEIQAQKLFTKTLWRAKFNALDINVRDIIRLHQTIGFKWAAASLFEQTFAEVSPFDDTTVDAMCSLQAADLREKAQQLFWKTIEQVKTWNISQIGKLKLATLSDEAHILYKRTMKNAPRTETLAIIRGLKAYGLDADAADFESKVVARQTKKENEWARKHNINTDILEIS